MIFVNTLLFAKSGFTNKEYKQHMVALEQNNTNLSDVDFTVILSKPFVIITDIESNEIREQNKEIVELSIKTFKKLFFANNPKNITDIWILKNRESFIHFNHAFLNSTDRDEVAGYYMQEMDALVVDISSGIGTIIHEMLHAFMNNNFNNAPTWFEEGLASLYEGTQLTNDGLKGDLNWRLPFLKETIRAKKLISFKELSDTNTSAFYSDESVSINYGHSRYLFYYLQEKGLLVEYYKIFSANVKDDPTGYKSLQKALKVKDMKLFQKEWEAYILGLEDWMSYLKRMSS